jgi:hypothetical protein
LRAQECGNLLGSKCRISRSLELFLSS